MKKTTSILVVAGLLYSINATNLNNTPPPTEPVKNCTTPGPFCETCTSTVMCVKQDLFALFADDDIYTKEGRAACKPGESCKLGACTTASNPKCNLLDTDFVCGNSGMFPHPTNWAKYYFCVPQPNGRLSATMATCEPDAAYNPKTTYCDKDLEALEQGETLPIPECTEIDKNTLKPLDENKTIYYECRSLDRNPALLYPFQNACSKGKMFDQYECKNP